MGSPGVAENHYVKDTMPAAGALLYHQHVHDRRPRRRLRCDAPPRCLLAATHAALVLAVSLGTADARRTRPSLAMGVSSGQASAIPLSSCAKYANCESCLQASTYTMLDTIADTYMPCKWCPKRFWHGSAKAFASKDALGVCADADATISLCGDDGGRRWDFVGKSAQNMNSTSAQLANEASAKWYCPKLPAERSTTDAWVVHELGELTSEDIENLEVLHIILGLLSLDFQRMNRLQTYHPILFGELFDSTMPITRYVWEATVFGIGFAPGAEWIGGGLALGLGIATQVADHREEELNRLQESSRTSQEGLCSTGREAKLQYFVDVSFGSLWDAYVSVFDLSNWSVAESHQKSAKKSVSGKLGQHSSAITKQANTGAYKVLSGLFHVGMLVGGFFTGGVTWAIDTVVGSGEALVMWSSKWLSTQSLKEKTYLLTALSRLVDGAMWHESQPHNEECSITDPNACPPVRLEKDLVMHRVCSRISPWENHVSVNPHGEQSPRGRCQPRVRIGLEDGMPCVAHEGCSSGYCHFEPRLSYFFSDHVRKFCPNAYLNDTHTVLCTPAKLQLFSLQAIALNPALHELQGPAHKDDPVRRPREFMGDYQGSFDGPLYATTGTCATACSTAGSGDCAELSLADSGKDSRQVKYGFGLRLPGWIFTHEKQGFEHLGQGACGESVVRNRREMEATRLLPVKVLNMAHARKAGDAAALDACARACWGNGRCRSFAYSQESSSCLLYGRHADRLVPQPGWHCYSQVLPWPMTVYQPWNTEWLHYLEDLKIVLRHLEDDSPRIYGPALRATLRAYGSFCEDIDPADTETYEDCAIPEEPEEAAKEVASSFLTLVAPLSAKQLRWVRDQVMPLAFMDIPAKAGDTISVEELFERPHDLAEGWRGYFLASGLPRTWEDWRRLQTRSVSKAWAQEIEKMAVSLRLRTKDGRWDFRAAHYRRFLDDSSVTMGTKEHRSP